MNGIPRLDKNEVIPIAFDLFLKMVSAQSRWRVLWYIFVRKLAETQSAHVVALRTTGVRLVAKV